ncbi:MAG: AMP-binding protein [Draconibacterium sp.]
MIEKYLKQTTFKDFEDFKANYELIIPEDFNFAYDVVDGWATQDPQKRALLWTNDQGESRTYTFGELKEITDRTAGYFSSLGIGKGDMVMAILKRRVEFWFTIIALHKIGAVIIPATHLLTKKDIVYRNNAATIKAIVCDGDKQIIEHVNDAMPESPSIEKLISIGPDIPEGWENFHQGIENAEPFQRPAEPTKNSDPIIVSFTSGTTGDPKMVLLNSVYPLAHIVTAKYWQNLHENSIHLTIADTGWLKAVWGKLYGQWLVGATVFVYDHEKFTPSAILEVLSEHKVTSLCAPPTIFRFLIREDLTHYDLSSLEWCTIAGEALNPEVYNRFFQLTGIKLREGYGQSETTLSVFTSPWVEPKPGSMGLPSPHYKVELLTSEGRPAEAGEQGQITIHYDKKYPAGLFDGYYRNPNLTHEAMSEGIYYTGDLAWKDEDGYFWFVGRADDVIKSSGYRIGPFEVESALMTHPAVVECAITGIPDEIRGQVVKATVVLAKEYKHKAGEAFAQELQDHVKQVTAPYKYPRVIEFVDELPKTISGKIRRVEIRERDHK